MQHMFISVTRYSALLAASPCMAPQTHALQAPSGTGVTLQEDDSAYTLANGIVAARIDKHSGDLLSLKYKGDEMLATIAGPDGLPDITTGKSGTNKRGGFGTNRVIDHQYGFWSHDTDGPNGSASKVTIDPKSNGGSRGEVEIKGLSEGKPMGAGPGGNFISDIEIRYGSGSWRRRHLHLLGDGASARLSGERVG
jgi:hypothetical protein